MDHVTYGAIPFVLTRQRQPQLAGSSPSSRLPFTGRFSPVFFVRRRNGTDRAEINSFHREKALLVSAASAAGDTEKRKMLEETTPDVLNAKGLLMFLRQSPSSATTSPSTSPELQPVATEEGLVLDSARSATGSGPASVGRGNGVDDVGGVGTVDSDADGGESCGDVDHGVGTSAAPAVAPRADVAVGNATAEAREVAPGNTAVARALLTPVPPPARPATASAAAAAPLRVANKWEEGENVTIGGVGAGDMETPVPGRSRRSKSTSLLSAPSSSVARSARGGGGGGDADGDSAVTIALLASPWGGGGGLTSTAVPVTPATPVAIPNAAAGGGGSGGDSPVARSLPVADTAMPMPAPRTAPKPRKPRFRLPVVTPSPSAAATPRQGQPQAPTGCAAAPASTPARSSSVAAPARQLQPVPVTPGTPSVRLAPVELFIPSPMAVSGGAVPDSDASAHASAPVVQRDDVSSSTRASEWAVSTGVTVQPSGGGFAASSKRKEEAEREAEGTVAEVQKRPRVSTS